MQALKDLLNHLALLGAKALDKIHLGKAAKAVVAALGPFITIWITTGQIDEKAIGAAAVGALLVFWFPNLTPAGQAVDQTT